MYNLKQAEKTKPVKLSILESSNTELIGGGEEIPGG